VQKKHVTTIKWTPIKIISGMGMGSALLPWIKAVHWCLASFRENPATA